jgi:hypothetical protein
MVFGIAGVLAAIVVGNVGLGVTTVVPLVFCRYGRPTKYAPAATPSRTITMPAIQVIGRGFRGGGAVTSGCRVG